MLLVLLAIASCQSAAAPKPAIANAADCMQPVEPGDPAKPYLFSGACVAIPHACNVNDCRAWKLQHGASETTAFEQCLDDCTCKDLDAD